MARTFGIDQLDTAHAVALADFLETPAGRNVLEVIESRIPELESNTIESTAMNAREAKGWRDCIKELVSMSRERPQERPPTEPAYMDMTLENDAKRRPQGEVH